MTTTLTQSKPNPATPSKPRRLAIVVAASLALATLSVGAQDDVSTEAESAPPVDPLAAIDPGWPAQAIFADWPPRELRQRHYWAPWAASSFQRARMFDRPILFVMMPTWNRAAVRYEREILGDPSVLEIINRDYIAIRVDPTLRPDLQERYQTAGAWPVVALLSANGNPMLTNIPENDSDTRRARPIVIGDVDVERMRFLLEEGVKYHLRWSDYLVVVGEEWVQREGPAPPTAGEIAEASSDGVARWMLANADVEGGGFGVAPKYVIPALAELAALRSSRQVPALEAHARRTLQRLVESPLFDRVEGGVHRIAIAPEYGAVQYEKLLDRNAALIRDLTFALRREDDPALRDALRSTCRFVVEVLGAPEGGFYAAQAADLDSESGDYYREADRGDSAPPVPRVKLAGSNAAAGAALLRAAAVLDDPTLAAAGIRALEVAASEHRPGAGVEHIVSPLVGGRRYLRTQADVALGLLDGYETTGRREWFEAARSIVDFVRRNLMADGESTFRDHLEQRGELGLLENPRRPLRGNVRMARAMNRLALHGADEVYGVEARVVLSEFAGGLAAYRAHATEAATAIEELIRRPVIVTIGGDPSTAETAALARAVARAPWPWTVATFDPSSPPGARIEGVERRFESPADLERALVELAEAIPSVATGVGEGS